jgi:hypothetical protein
MLNPSASSFGASVSSGFSLSTQLSVLPIGPLLKRQTRRWVSTSRLLRTSKQDAEPSNCVRLVTLPSHFEILLVAIDLQSNTGRAQQQLIFSDATVMEFDCAVTRLW